MNYKKTNEIDMYFFSGEVLKTKKKTNIKKPINNPFEKLLSLNIKQTMEEKIKNKTLVCIAALLIHVAKIDQNYSTKEDYIKRRI